MAATNKRGGLLFHHVTMSADNVAHVVRQSQRPVGFPAKGQSVEWRQQQAIPRKRKRRGGEHTSSFLPSDHTIPITRLDKMPYTPRKAFSESAATQAKMMMVARPLTSLVAFPFQSSALA